MNKILTVSVLLGVTVIMMGSILPAIAQSGIQTDQTQQRPSAPLYTDGVCEQEVGTCTVVIDANRNNICDDSDPRVTMPIKAVEKLGIGLCP